MKTATITSRAAAWLFLEILSRNPNRQCRETSTYWRETGCRTGSDVSQAFVHPAVMPQYSVRRWYGVPMEGPILLHKSMTRTELKPSLSQRLSIAANHTLVSRSAFGTRVSTPSKSNSAASKSRSGCLSCVSVSVLIFAKKTDVGPVIDECVLEQVHGLAREGRRPRARLPVGGSDVSASPLHLFLLRPGLIQSNSRGFTQSNSCGCTSEDFLLIFAPI